MGFVRLTKDAKKRPRLAVFPSFDVRQNSLKEILDEKNAPFAPFRLNEGKCSWAYENPRVPRDINIDKVERWLGTT